MKDRASADIQNRAQFNEVLEAADLLSLEEQQDLVEIVNHRLADRRRSELAKDVQSARQEFENGECRPATADQLIKEISS